MIVAVPRICSENCANLTILNEVQGLSMILMAAVQTASMLSTYVVFITTNLILLCNFKWITFFSFKNARRKWAVWKSHSYA